MEKDLEKERKRLESATGTGLGEMFLRYDGDHELLEDVAKEFLHHSDHMWTKISEHVHAGEFKEANEQVERFTSAASHMAIRPLLEASAEFQKLLAEEDSNLHLSCQNMIEKLDIVSQTIRKFLKVISLS